MNATTPPVAGGYATELLVTDTRAYDVVAVTPATIVVRPRRTVSGPALSFDDWVAVSDTESVPEAPTRRVRRRKDGTYRMARWANPLWFGTEPPRTRVDWKM